MSRAKDLQDLAILRAISGIEDPQHLGMQVEGNYLVRERMENLREQGFIVPEEYIPEIRSQKEKDLWKRVKWLEQLEQARTNRPEIVYDGQEEEEVAEKKEMGFVDPSIFAKVFATNVNIKQVKSNVSGRWITIITLGKLQDKVFLVTARKDGQGVTLLTDWDEYMVNKEVLAKKEVTKV